jgi:subtilisin family serine protease
MIGPVPDGSTLATTRPDSVFAPGYTELSGTSFASPIVAGAAAYLLALDPKLKPDQVKGALMLSAKPEPNATPGSVGTGLVDLAAAGQVNKPPNPNLALDNFVKADPKNGPIPVFDTAAWQAAALKNPDWDGPTWNAAAWGSAAWGTAAWGSSALAQQLASSDSAWGSAAWGTAATANVAPDIVLPAALLASARP